MDSLVTS